MLFKHNMEDVNIVSYSLQYPKILFPGTKQFMENFDQDVEGVHHLINTLNPFSWLKSARYFKSNSKICYCKVLAPIFCFMFKRYL